MLDLHDYRLHDEAAVAVEIILHCSTRKVEAAGHAWTPRVVNRDCILDDMGRNHRQGNTMVELDTSAADACPSVVQMAPSDIARRQFTKWNGIGAESVELTRRERFEFGYQAPCHLVVMSERADRVEGETLIDGAPTSMLHALGRKLSLVPGGHQLRGWQTPRALNGATFFYLNPRGPLLDPELRFAETALKLKTEAENPGRAQQSYAEALGIVLAHELLRLNSHTAPPSQYISGGLAGWQ